MRTFEARQYDVQKADKSQHDPKTRAGAEAILSMPESKMLAKQTIAILFREGPKAVPALPASKNVRLALQALGIVKVKDPKKQLIELTLTGWKLARDGNRRN